MEGNFTCDHVTKGYEVCRVGKISLSKGKQRITKKGCLESGI